MKRALTTIAFGLAASVAFSGAASAQQTLAQVTDRDELICGANPGLAGFGVPDAQGNWTGFDVDYCRAIAAAIFGDTQKVSFIPLSAKDRFTALQSGEIDVLVRNSTSTMSRDTSLGLDFPGINYYDGQGFLVRRISASPRRSSSAVRRSVSRMEPRQSSIWTIISAPRESAMNPSFSALPSRRSMPI